ncbi:hypothetical protein G3142_005547 [Salmonella enterica subsp. enterica serovar Montevideo]|nr:hypothetical protein [Salmonella enterica subsp. enterica serovar Montevideo]EEK7813940.1 hypothetical protein [Salmonella enterica subsp. enterica serovar Montevideo]
MNIKPETREILRQYKALINARRRDAGQRVRPPVSPREKPCRLTPAGGGPEPRFAPLPVLSPLCL